MKIIIPDKNKKQIARAVMGLVTALLLLGASVGGQVVYQLLGLEPVPIVVPLEDELMSLGTTNFTALAAEDLTLSDDLVVGDDTTMSGDLAVTGAVTAANIDMSGNLDFDGDILYLGDQIGNMIGFGTSTVTTDTVYHLLELYDSTPVMTAGTNSMVGLDIDFGIGNSTGGTNTVYGVFIESISQDASNTETGIAVGAGWDLAADFNGSVDIDAGSLTVDGEVTNIGGGTPGLAAGDNDLYVTGDFEVDTTAQLDGALDANSTANIQGALTVQAGIVGSQDIENVMYPTVVSTAITYTAAAGGTGAVATIADGEIWLVWGVFVNVTTDFDCTGDDATLVVGDGADTDGFVVLADAELQTADTEQTGSPAGWQGLVAATMGVYLDGAVSSAPHIYAPSGAAETIDWIVDESSGESITAGAATIYVVYTRIQ